MPVGPWNREALHLTILLGAVKAPYLGPSWAKLIGTSRIRPRGDALSGSPGGRQVQMRLRTTPVLSEHLPSHGSAASVINTLQEKSLVIAYVADKPLHPARLHR